MDIRGLKKYIYENKYIEQILEAIGCHHIQYHFSGDYFTCANADGDNKKAIVVYNSESLNCINYTRNITKINRPADLIDLVCYAKNISFPEGLKYISSELGISYYYDFDEDTPESLKLLDMLDDLKSGDITEEKTVLKPISETVLSYYKPYVNALFYEDNIDYATQKEFEIGFDMFTNRYTIPIRSEIGDLIGVKGRYFYRNVPEVKNKYIYIEPCPKSKVIYGLNKTLPFIKRQGRVYIGESEKFVMQLWSYGYRNSGAIGGKELSVYQNNLLIRIGADIVFCFDKDVKKSEYEDTAKSFPEGIPLYYVYDEDNILSPKEAPSDDPYKWQHLIENNIYRLR